MLPIAFAVLLCALVVVVTPTAGTNDFVVMSYNVMQLTVTSWDQKQRALAFEKAIRGLKTQPDVITLQEAMHIEIQDALTRLKDLYPHQTLILGKDCAADRTYWTTLTGVCKRPKAVVPSGVITISKHRILSKHGLFFKSFDEKTFDAIAAKGAILVTVERDGKDGNPSQRYHVMGTHLQSSAGKVDGASEDKQRQVRMKQLQEMKKLVDDLRIPKDEPVIIGGDMNVPLYVKTEGLSNSEVKEMVSKSNAVMNYKMDSKAIKEKISSYSCPTNWLVKFFMKNLSFGADVKCVEDTLDYIFVRKDHLQENRPAEGYEILLLKTEKSMFWKELKGKFPFKVNGDSNEHDGMHNDVSDHYPVVQSFSFYPRGKGSLSSKGSVQGSANVIQFTSKIVLAMAFVAAFIY